MPLPKPLQRVYLVAAALSGLAWIIACVVVVRGLVAAAASAPAGAIEEYARDPGFQLLSFCVAYLPLLAVMLVALLAVEWTLLRWLGWVLARPRAPRRSGTRLGRPAEPRRQPEDGSQKP